MSAQTYQRVLWLNWTARLLSLVLAAVISTASWLLAFPPADAQPRTVSERLAVAENRLDVLGWTDSKLSDEIRSVRDEQNTMRLRIDGLEQRVAMGQGAIGVVGVLFTIIQLVQMSTDRRVRKHRDPE